LGKIKKTTRNIEKRKTKKGNAATKIVNKMKTNNNNGKTIDKIHLGQFEQFGVNRSENYRGKQKE